MELPEPGPPGTSAGSCPNCGAPVAGKYCPGCGQRQGPVTLSVRRLLRDVLEDQFSLNSAFPRTVRGLLFHPGFLTNEYLNLRITRYIPPFRLYLITSVLFFVLASFLSSRAEFNINETVESARDSVRAEARRTGDTLTVRRPYLGVRPPPRDTAAGLRIGISRDSSENWLEDVSVNMPIDWLDKALEARLRELGKLPPDEALHRLIAATIQHTPKIMFVLLPVYAFMLKLLYIRRKRYYVEHFIFALHVHSFLFLCFFVLLLFRSVRGVTPVIAIWMPIYMLWAMKRVYAQGWIKTLLKAGVLGFAYFLLISLGFVAAVIGAMLTA